MGEEGGRELTFKSKVCTLEQSRLPSSNSLSPVWGTGRTNYKEQLSSLITAEIILTQWGWGGGE